MANEKVRTSRAVGSGARQRAVCEAQTGSALEGTLGGGLREPGTRLHVKDYAGTEP